MDSGIPTKITMLGKFLETTLFSGNLAVLIGTMIVLFFSIFFVIVGSSMFKPHRVGFFMAFFFVVYQGWVWPNTVLWRVLGPSGYDYFKWCFIAAGILFLMIFKWVVAKKSHEEGYHPLQLFLGYLLTPGILIYLLFVHLQGDFGFGPKPAYADSCSPYTSTCYYDRGFNGDPAYSSDRFHNGVKIIDLYDYKYIEKLKQVINYRKQMTEDRTTALDAISLRHNKNEVSLEIRRYLLQEKKKYTKFVEQTLNFPSELKDTDAQYVKQVLLSDSGWFE